LGEGEPVARGDRDFDQVGHVATADVAEIAGDRGLAGEPARTARRVVVIDHQHHRVVRVHIGKRLGIAPFDGVLERGDGHRFGFALVFDLDLDLRAADLQYPVLPELDGSA